MFQLRSFTTMGAVAVAWLLYATTEATAVNCPGTITTDYNATEDIIQTNTGSCFTLNTANKTINLNGKKIICNRATGCNAAISIGASGALINNGYIVSGTGLWDDGVFNGTSSSINLNTTVRRITFSGVQIGVLNPAQVEHSVFLNAPIVCVFGFGSRMPSGSQITENYCSTPGIGISVKGPASASNVVIRRNYVDSSGGTAIDTTSGGFISVEHNIVQEGDITPGADTTLSENLCSDLTYCPEPGSDFNMTLDFVLP